jgi:hypothetical protein
VSASIASILSWSRRRRATVAITMLALVLASLVGVRRLAFDTDVLTLLPHEGRVIPAFRTFLASFGSLDDLYIVFSAPPGHAIADYEADVDAWLEALRHTPEIVRVDSGTTTLTDGPFAETKEQLGGFWVIRSADLDEALAWAEKCAQACMNPVEVRPFEDEPGE